MNGFLKLTSMIINKSHIVKITQEQSKYVIHTTANNLDGRTFFGSGFFINQNEIIEIHENSRKDYTAVSDFIKNPNI